MFDPSGLVVYLSTNQFFEGNWSFPSAFLFGKSTMKGFVKKMYHKWPQRNSPDSKGKVKADLNRDSKTTSLSTFLGTRGS